jgi:hypothetical protein
VTAERDVLVFVHRGDEALVLLGREGWSVVTAAPGEGETPAAAAARALRQVTGLEAPVHSLRGPEGSAWFALEPPRGWEPELGAGHVEYRWCAFGEAAVLVGGGGEAEGLRLLESRLRRRRSFRLTLRRPRSPGVFFLRFGEEGPAHETAAVLRADGYDVSVEAEPAHWLVRARGNVRRDSFDVAERALAALAEAKGGSFVGSRRGAE